METRSHFDCKKPEQFFMDTDMCIRIRIWKYGILTVALLLISHFIHERHWLSWTIHANDQEFSATLVSTVTVPSLCCIMDSTRQKHQTLSFRPSDSLHQNENSCSLR